jgi:hypothetical protein
LVRRQMPSSVVYSGPRRPVGPKGSATIIHVTSRMSAISTENTAAPIQSFCGRYRTTNNTHSPAAPKTGTHAGWRLKIAARPAAAKPIKAPTVPGTSMSWSETAAPTAREDCIRPPLSLSSGKADPALESPCARWALRGRARGVRRDRRVPNLAI